MSTNATDTVQPTADAATADGPGAAAAAGEAAAAAGQAAMSFMTSASTTIQGVNWMGILNLVMSYVIYFGSWLPYLLFLYSLYQLSFYIYKYVMTLRVVGEPNEWVVIMRDGQEVQSGIGLSCFRGPFDQVAKFPSNLVKVEIKTQQITKEYQGLEVQSFIEWTIDRNNPLKAYKNLDLASGNNHMANTTLQSMTSAIVRNQIANSTLDNILKNRQQIRDEIIKEMNEVVVGWGVHLATVEVTDVKICSGSLFSDMQAKFREESQKKATLEKLAVENTIYFDQLERALETSKRNANTQKIQMEAQNAEELKKTKEEIEQYKIACEIEKKETKRHNAEKLRQKSNEEQFQKKVLEQELAAMKVHCDKLCHNERSQREIQSKRDEERRIQLQTKIANDKVKAQAARDLKEKDYMLLKEKFKDRNISKLHYMDLIGDLYSSVRFGSLYINHMGEEDPIAQIVSKFTKMAENEENVDEQME